METRTQGLLCDVYYTTELGETDCTRMFAMDSRHFKDWPAEREEIITSIEDFSVQTDLKFDPKISEKQGSNLRPFSPGKLSTSNQCPQSP